MSEKNENTGYLGTTRPTVDIQLAWDIITKYYGLKTVEIVELESSGDRNFRVTTQQDKHQVDYILKVVNSHESIPIFHETIAAIMDKLLKNGFVTSKMIPSKDGRPFLLLPIFTSSGKEELCLVKLLTYLPGQPLRSLSINPTTQFELGQLLAHFHLTLQDFPSTSLSVDPRNPWGAENPLVVLQLLTPSLTKETVQIVTKISETLHRILHNSTAQLAKGVIHGDLTDLNIIVNPDVPSTSDIKQKYGIIDFNDFCHSFIILEVGRLIADQLLAYTGQMPRTECTGDRLQKHPIKDDARTETEIPGEVGRDQITRKPKVGIGALIEITLQILKGYLSVTELSPLDLQALYWSIGGAFSQYLVLCEYNKLHQPENPFAAEAARDSNILILEWDKIDPEIFLESITNLSNNIIDK